MRVDKDVIISSRAFELRTPCFNVDMVSVEKRVGINISSAQFESTGVLKNKTWINLMPLINRCLTYTLARLCPLKCSC